MLTHTTQCNKEISQFLFADRGSVLKISKPAGVHQPCLLTELDVFPVSAIYMSSVNTVALD